MPDVAHILGTFFMGGWGEPMAEVRNLGRYFAGWGGDSLRDGKVRTEFGSGAGCLQIRRAWHGLWGLGEEP